VAGLRGKPLVLITKIKADKCIFFMRPKYIVLFLLFWHGKVSAQLTITPGGQFAVFSDTKLVLNNMDLINNGDFLLATTTPVSFSGDASSIIAGDQAVRFFKLEINKTGNQSVILHKTINVGGGVFFTSGFLDLNGSDVELETSGTIHGETEVTRFVGASGGQIIVTTTLNTPVNVNPGNLGIFITSSQNLGQVVVRRGHQLQNGTGLASSILRYYQLSPANNNNIDATLRLHYFDAELNGINKNSLELFKSDNSTSWSDLGFTSTDPTANFVEKTAINSLSRFTLSNNDNSPLPVRFISFNANCDNGKVQLAWKTAQEQNSSYFSVERSTNSRNWTVLSKLPSAGSSATEKVYVYSDNTPQQNSFYRIGEHDIDGTFQYTNVVKSSCIETEVLKVLPNPVHGQVMIRIVSNTESGAVIKLFDNSGALIKMQEAKLLKGDNQLTVEMTSFSSGLYHLQVQWNNGQTSKGIQLLKQ
jgi:hypothetical protein